MHKDHISDKEKAENVGVKPEDVAPEGADVPLDDFEPNAFVGETKELKSAAKQLAEFLDAGVAISDLELVTDRNGQLVRVTRTNS